MKPSIICIETGKRYRELSPDETVQLHDAYVCNKNKSGFGIVEIIDPGDSFIGERPQCSPHFYGLTFLRHVP